MNIQSPVDSTQTARAAFLALVKGENRRTQGLGLLDALEARDIHVLEVRQGELLDSIDFVLEHGVIRQSFNKGYQATLLSGWIHIPTDGNTTALRKVGPDTVDVSEAVSIYEADVRPADIVERAVKAREAAGDDARRASRSRSESAIIEAYEDLPAELRTAFGKVIAYLALVEGRMQGQSDTPVARRLVELLDVAPIVIPPAAGHPSDDLRRIVTDHTRVGGYPDTMGIARAAYALGMVQKAADTTDGVNWDGDLVAEHIGGPVPGSPAQRKGGTVVRVTAHRTIGGQMAVMGIPEFINGLFAQSDGTTSTHWRIRNAEPGDTTS